MAQTADFTRGKIAGPLIRFTIPMLLAMLLQSLYGAVDLMIVGQFGSPADVSAVATGTQIMMFVTVVFIGLAAGMTILLGQSIGAGKKEEAGKIVGSGIMLFIVMAAAMTILMMFLTDPFTRVMQAPKEAFFKTTQYVRICSGGIAFIVAYNVLGSIFRGIGDSKTGGRLSNGLQHRRRLIAGRRIPYGGGRSRAGHGPGAGHQRAVVPSDHSKKRTPVFVS